MFQLRVLSGSKAGQVFQLAPGQPFVVGRGAEANLSVPDDPTLSRNHADVVIEGGQAVLRNRSQHGSLVGGQVVQGQAPVALGQEFQVGGTRLVLEPMAGGAAAAPVGGPVGAASGGGGGGPKVDAGAAFAAAAKFGGDGGQAKIEHSGPGFPFGDLVKGGISVVKANLMASLALSAPLGLLILVQVGLSFGARFMPGIVAMILGFTLMGVGLLYSLASPLLFTNYLAAVKEFQSSGKPIGIGDLLKFNDIVNRYITMFIVGIAAGCCFLLGPIVAWAIPIIVDKPGIGFANALKASVAFGKKNYVPTFILFIILGIVNSIGMMLCGLGVLITMPAVNVAFFLAYDLKRDEVAAAAAESGVSL
ncbi:MAG: FHA domain-containing protein [Planctomycetes bacterium]|nr:FHA domain-containing protein [Planctomycetota bacterium]